MKFDDCTHIDLDGKWETPSNRNRFLLACINTSDRFIGSVRSVNATNDYLPLLVELKKSVEHSAARRRFLLLLMLIRVTSDQDSQQTDSIKGGQDGIRRRHSWSWLICFRWDTGMIAEPSEGGPMIAARDRSGLKLDAAFCGCLDVRFAVVHQRTQHDTGRLIVACRHELHCSTRAAVWDYLTHLAAVFVLKRPGHVKPWSCGVRLEHWQREARKAGQAVDLNGSFRHLVALARSSDRNCRVHPIADDPMLPALLPQLGDVSPQESIPAVNADLNH